MTNIQYIDKVQSVTINGKTYVQKCKKEIINGKERQVCKRIIFDNNDKQINKPKYNLSK